MLRKTLFAGVVVIVIVILALPLVFSFKLGKYESQYASALSQSHWTQVKHMYVSRGWFSTRSRITMAPVDALCSKDCPHLQINSTVYHGPLPFGAFEKAGLDTQFALGIIISKVWLTFPDKTVKFHPALPPLKIITIIHTDGSQDMRINMPSSHSKFSTASGQYALQINPIQGTADIDRNGQLQQLHIQAKGGNVRTYPGKILLFLAQDGDLKTQRTDAGGVRLTQSIQKLDMPGPNDAPLEIQNMQLKSNSVTLDGRANGTVHVHINNLYTEKRHWSPLKFSLQVKHINTPALQKLNTELLQVTSSGLSPAMKLLGALSAYHENATALLSTNPEIDLNNFVLGTDKSYLRARMHIKFKHADTASKSGLSSLIDSLDLKGFVRTPKSWMRALMRRRLRVEKNRNPAPDEVALSIKNLAKRGVIEPYPKENAWDTDLRLKNGKLTFNGKPSSGWKDLRSELRNLLAKAAGKHGHKPDQTGTAGTN